MWNFNENAPSSSSIPSSSSSLLFWLWHRSMCSTAAKLSIGKSSWAALLSQECQIEWQPISGKPICGCQINMEWTNRARKTTSEASLIKPLFHSYCTLGINTPFNLSHCLRITFQGVSAEDCNDSGWAIIVLAVLVPAQVMLNDLVSCKSKATEA